MTPGKSAMPKTRRRFANPWGELDYLCQKVRYWLYGKNQKTQARRYSARLERVLRDLPENDLAIIRQEGLALLAELKGEVADAIAHRRQEIKLMERLHREARSPRYADGTKSYMLRDRGTAALQERRAILARLENAKARPGNGPAGRAFIRRVS